MATNLQDRKIELIQWLSVIDDDALLEKIAVLKEQQTSDWWDEISDREKGFDRPWHRGRGRRQSETSR